VVLTNAYAIEVFVLSWNLATLFFQCWMIRDTTSDYYYAKAEHAPPAWILTAFGRIMAEVCRVVITLLLIWIGWWMVTHPPPNEIREFFNPTQFAAGRNILALLTVANTLASTIERYYRREALRQNGITGARLPMRQKHVKKI
jgi:hypothetical protein